MDLGLVRTLGVNPHLLHVISARGVMLTNERSETLNFGFGN
jgi:hypothetical protein